MTRYSSIRRVGAFALVMLALAGDAEAQDPYAPPEPGWTSDAVAQTVTLWPTLAKLGVGVAQPSARLHVVGTEVVQQPGSGYLVLGAINTLHMQLDRNEIRVAGPTADTVGALYLQRFGGPISIRSSLDAAQRIVMPAEGGLAVGTADPFDYAVSQAFVGDEWPQPNAAIGVDGDVYGDRVFAHEGRFLERLRVGVRGNGIPGGAMDEAESDALAMIGGKLTAHEIVVHIKGWADDVFDPDYPLRSLPDTRAFIDEHGHLPDFPSEAEVREQGMDVAEMNALLLRKVEELTLHAIDQQARIDALEAKIDACD